MKTKSIIKKKAGLSVSMWVLAIALAMVVLAVVGLVLSTTWMVATTPQEVRSQASTRGTETPTPIVTTVKIAKIDDTELAEASPSSTASPQPESSPQTKTSPQPLQNAPQGVTFIYVLLGIGIVVFGIAAGLIYVITKFLGGA